MSRRVRTWVFVISCLAAAGLLCWGVMGLPPYGHYRGAYGIIIDRSTVAETGATNAVSAVVFDYRGMDTMVEEFIFFTAVIGTALLLRVQREEAEEPPSDESPERDVPGVSQAVQAGGLFVVATTFLFGIYMIAHGHLTPGGGFQGGVILGTAIFTIHLAGDFGAMTRTVPHSVVDALEPAGAASYVFVGLAAVALGAAFLTNVLPEGVRGTLQSAGTVPVLNAVVGLEVGAGVAVIVFEMLAQTLTVREKPGVPS